MANTADTSKAGKIVEVTFTGTGADWNYSTDGGFDEMYVKSIIWHPSGADDVLVMNEGGVDGPSIVHWKAYTDLVTNGSFTADTTGWEGYRGDEILTSETGGQAGNGLKIQEGGTFNPIARQLTISLTEGKSYKATLYVKQGTESTWNSYIADGVGTHYINPSGASNDEATSAFVRHAIFFMSQNTKATCTLNLSLFCGAASGKTIYFDEVTVEELPINKQISFGEKGVPLKPYIDITDCTFSDITATKIIFILE